MCGLGGLLRRYYRPQPLARKRHIIPVEFDSDIAAAEALRGCRGRAATKERIQYDPVPWGACENARLY